MGKTTDKDLEYKGVEKLVLWGFSAALWGWVILTTLTFAAFSVAAALGAVKLLMWVISLF